MSEQELVERSRDGDPRRMTLYVGVGLVLILGLGLLLRTWGLSSEQPWWDEFAAIRSLNEPSFSAYYQASREFMPATCPPLFVLLYGMAKMGLNVPVHFRALSIGFGMISLVAIFLVGRKVLGTRGGLLVAALCSVHSWLVYYSQEIREYPLLILLTILSSLCYVSMLEKPNRRLSLAGCVCLNSCLLVSHLMSVFFVLAQLFHFVAFASRGEKRKNAAIFVLLHVPGFLLWGMLCMTVDATKMAESSVDFLSLHHGVVHFLLCILELAGARSVLVQFGMFLFPWSLLVNGTIAAGVVLGAFTALRACLRDKTATHDTPSRFVFSYLIIWAFLPPMILYGISWFVKPCFMTRYVVESSPALVLLIALALTRVRRNDLFAATSGTVLIALLCVSLAHPLPLRGNFAEVSGFVTRMANPNECVCTSSPMLAMMMSYYADLKKDPGPAESPNGKRVHFAYGAPTQAPRIYVDGGPPSQRKSNNEEALRATGHTYRTYSFLRPIRLSPLMDSTSVPRLTIYIRESP